MKNLKKLKLSEMSKTELQAREMNKLLGGENCCICSCYGSLPALNHGNSAHGKGVEDSGGGYGSGAYA